MPFEYRARDQRGRLVKGRVDEVNRSGARKALRERGLYVTELRSITGSPGNGASGEGAPLRWAPLRIRKRRPGRELAAALRQLATMLDSGMTLIDALNTLLEQGCPDALSEGFSGVRNDVERGLSLASAFQRQGCFPEYLSAMVRAGEEAGALHSVLLRTSATFEREATLGEEIKNALLYPLIVLTVAAAVVVFLIIYVLPAFTGMLFEMGLPIPLLTRLVISITDLLSGYAKYLLPCAGLFLGALFLGWEGPWLRELRLHILLRMPLLGRLVFGIMLCRTCHLMGVLLSSGLKLNTALHLTSRLYEFRAYRQFFHELSRRVEEGSSLSGVGSLREVGLPPMVISMLRTGERSGSLDLVFRQIADHHEREVEHLLKRYTGLIEPIMILFLGLIVGTIVTATVMPLFSVLTTGLY